MKVKSEREVAQSCPTLSDPMDCSLPGASVHGIFQARVLEWGAMLGAVKINITEMFRPASFSLYLLCSQEKERKTNSFLFFSLFTVQYSCSVGDLFSCGLWNLLVVPCSGTEPWLPALGTQSRSPWIIREVPMSFLNLFIFRFSSVQLLGRVRLFATP